MPYARLLGRDSVPKAWTPEERAHYLALPDDPRYPALAEELLRDIDPRFMSDDLMKALVIKRHLETHGFYTRKKTYNDVEDPTAAFLFGDLHGYCVHFAHSAALLFRSVGIASRVAIGYAVDTRLQGGGSTVLVMADRAHAWPEIYLDGVGWITFDIYPEQSDEVPQVVVSRSLESMLGELAREDKTAGRAADPATTAWEIPWGAIGLGLLFALAGLLAIAFGGKWSRQVLARQSPRFAFAATLDAFADLGERRRLGESRERFAQRLAPLAPSLVPLTRSHLRSVLGRGPDQDIHALRRQVQAELRAALPWWRRLLAHLNPVGWLLTR
ncbi:MAG: transglutaminase-like domain-containing protein [bacterium]